METLGNFRRVFIHPGKFLLDPNNPRLITRDANRVPEDRWLDADVVSQTNQRMKERFKVEELMHSIKENGWIPVDSIFVRQFRDTDRYVVLEGNRRITAIISLLEDDNLAPPLRESLQKIDCLELEDRGLSEELIQQKIHYILGVRHHGSLKQWSPFAQARNCFTRYLEYGQMTEESFNWNTDIGSKVANMLSIETSAVRDALKVYRAMEDVQTLPTVNRVKGVKGKHFSLFREALFKKSQEMRDYFFQDGESFHLSEQACARFDNLCFFSQGEEGRKSSPIVNPREWSPFQNILKEQDEEIRLRMLKEVEEDHIPPSIVWAKRNAELKKTRWDSWLKELKGILSNLNINEVNDTDEERIVIRAVLDVITRLKETADQGQEDETHVS